MFQTILVPTDGSENAGKAMDAAIDLAVKYRSRLLVLHVLLRDASTAELRRAVDVDSLDAETRKQIDALGGTSAPIPVGNRMPTSGASHALLDKVADLILQRAEQAARQAGVQEVVCLKEDGNPGKRITAVAGKEKVDLLVMGSRGLGAWGNFLYGSVSQHVKHACHCSHLTIV